MKKLITILLVILLIGVFYWWRSPHTVQGHSSDIEFQYIVRISGNGGSSDALPMIIALHGHGDTPENFFDTLLNRFDYLARFIVMRGPLDYPGASLSGRAWPSDSQEILEYGDALADAVIVLEEDFPVVGKPIVLGFSGGASMAYYLAAFHAERFSYIFPLAGRLPRVQKSSETVSSGGRAKVIAFHGRNDQVIGYGNGKAAVESLRQRGLSAELISFNGGHLSIFRSANKLLLNHLSDALHEIAP